MKNSSEDPSVNFRSSDRRSKLAWLLVGAGIGAVAAVLLAPQSGDNTREWISTTCKDGMDAVDSTLKETRRHLEDWLSQRQQQVSAALSAGREAFQKARPN